MGVLRIGWMAVVVGYWDLVYSMHGKWMLGLDVVTQSEIDS